MSETPMDKKRLVRNLAWASFLAYSAFLFYAVIGWVLMWPSSHLMYLTQIFPILEKDMNSVAVPFWSLYALNMIVLDDFGYEHPRAALVFFVGFMGIVSLNAYHDSTWFNILMTAIFGLLFVSWVAQLRSRGLSTNSLMSDLAEV